jgi:hypothetical protein
MNRWAIDWDDTCVDNAWPRNNGAWKEGAVAGLRELTTHGEVVIFTSRIAAWEPDELAPRTAAQVAFEIESIRSRLREQGLDGVEVWTKDYKPPAHAYLDDKAVHYNGRKGAWKAVVPKLLLLGGISPAYLYDREEEAAD